MLNVTLPYTVVVALEDNSTFYIIDEKISLPRGRCIILRGNVAHSSSEYEVDNIRYHIYMDVADEHVAQEGTHVHWL